MSIEVIPVSGLLERREFLKLPFHVYRDDPNWISPLVSEQRRLIFARKHSYWREGSIEPFIARRDGRTVGRIAAVVNDAHNRYHGENVGFFGFFEVLDAAADMKAAGETTRAMLAAVEARLKEQGFDHIRGPASPSSNYEWGCMVEGHGEPPIFLMPYNPPEYQALFEAYGLAKAVDVVSLFFEAKELPEKAHRVAALAQRKGYRIRNLDMAKFERDTELILDIYNNAWERNWGFVPMGREEFMEQAREMKPLAIPSLIKIVEHEGEAVAFSLSMPDYNVALRKMRGRLLPLGIFQVLALKRRPARGGIARVITLGVKQAHRRRGVDALLTVESVKAGHDLGIWKADFGWVLETNTEALQLFEHLGGRIYKRYRIYEKPLS